MSEPTRVQFRYWIWLAVVAATVYVLSSMYAEKSIGESRWRIEGSVSTAGRGDLGFITAGTNLCRADNTTPGAIKLLDDWTALMERLEAAGGSIFLSEEDNALGTNMCSWCSTLAEGYPVVLFYVDGEYAMLHWEESLGFGNHPFIIKLRDFQAGGLRL